MNDIFDFGRFGKLFVYECRNYLPRYIKGLVVFAGFLVAAWMLSMSIGGVMPDRSGYIGVLYNFAIILSPYFIYKHINDRKRGYSYAMIPASTLEKLLSMTIVSFIVVPVTVYAALTLTDVVLYALSSIGLGRFTGIILYNPFEVFIEDFGAPVGNVLLATFATISTAVMFNSIFRKSKIIKTVLFNMTAGFLLSLLAITLVQLTSQEFWENMADRIGQFFRAYTYEEVIALYNTLATLGHLLVICVTLAITYFRIKKVNY